MGFNVVLVRPEIPQNTGNIVRTCAATGSKLHLVHPLGFGITDCKLRRAGLDYWHMTGVFHYDSFDEVLDVGGGAKFHFATRRRGLRYDERAYANGDFLVFGCETSGLPDALIEQYASSCVRLPMVEGTRSLNLSNAVAVIVYEALRQCGFPGLSLT